MTAVLICITLTSHAGTARQGDTSGNAASATQAGISGIAGNPAVRTADANTGIKPIFNKVAEQADVNAQVAISSAFSNQAPKAVATFANNQASRLRAQGQEDEAKKWDEGGIYRVVLHTVTGAASAGISGAAGAASVATAAPTLNQLQSAITQRLQAAGMSPAASDFIAQGITGVGAVAIGAAVGGPQGAATGYTVDANNRQLHPVERLRIRTLANGDPAKEVRLTAAACALVHCADGVPTNDPNYAYLKALQDSGAGYVNEQQLLLQRSGSGDSTRTFGPLFTYDKVDEYLIDPFTQNRVGTRLVGAGQAGLGVLGVAGSSVLCTTGIGCGAALVSGTISADYAVAGVKQAATGETQTPYGEQVLQSLGLSPQTAAITYGVLGIAPAAVGATGVRLPGAVVTTGVPGAAAVNTGSNRTVVGSAANNIYAETRPMASVFPERSGVNPHYVEGATTGLNTNCVSCVNAAQQRLTGQNPNAVASPSAGYANENALLPSSPFGFGNPTNPGAVVAEMQAAGSGAARPLIIEQNGVSHVINVTNRNGQVYFIDTQLGQIVTLQPGVVVKLGRSPL